ncbi:hypothetical protein Rhopal_004088-T1 [Rhodotorula paludigena]|uniref:Proteophosphoglycan ppg4 n=1 Tax=Rhodotorula paludigena TaxID=86838 RepID=A0AAV5GQX2_9BASI|nr:hypothetical protein Rhopal_004088-T1 [Rhodotorula paludigena]
MSFASSSATLDESQWAAATYAQAPAHGTAAPSYAYDASYHDAYAVEPSAYLETGIASDPRGSYAYYEDGGASLYADSYTYAPQRTYSGGTTPSPALPALSPASSASASSSFSGFVSPHQQHASAVTTPELHRTGVHARLSAPRPAMRLAKSRSAGGFAEMQETYLQQRQPPDVAYYPAQSVSSNYAATVPPSLAAPPSTPRRNAPSASHLYRSPSAYSVTSPSSSSPYHRPTTPRSAYPSDTPASSRARRGSTGGVLDSPSRRPTTPRRVAAVTTSVDANGSPTKSIRRVARLSIEVPPAYRSPGSCPAPSTARAPPQQQQQLAPPPQPFYAPSPAEPEQLSEASLREVEQLLGELGPILETPSFDQDLGASVHSYTSGYEVPLTPTSVSISGVTLSAEDLALLDDPSLAAPDLLESPLQSRMYPSSAPAWRTTFDFPPPPPPSMQFTQSQQYSSYPAEPLSRFSHSHSLTHSASVGSLAPPLNPHVRARSANGVVYRPPLGTHRSDSAAAPPPPSPSVSARRRRSSVDSAALAVPPPHWPRGMSYPYHPSLQELPTVLQPLPATPQDGLARPVTPPPSVKNKALASSTSKASPGGAKTTPKRKRGSPTKAKAPVAMFVNYSAQDAKKLLNGVAPSGSTKKRRDEEDGNRPSSASTGASSSSTQSAPVP